MPKILKRRVDAWAVALVTAVFFSQLALYLFASPAHALLAVLALMPFCASIVAYNHNHIHARTFAVRSLNSLFELVLFFQTGSSPFAGTLNHILGHHGTYFEPELDTLNWRRGDGSRMGMHEFALKKALRHYSSCWIFGPRSPLIFKRFLANLAVCVVLLAGLVAYKPTMALIVFVLPMCAMLYALKWGAYHHHSGLPIGDDFTASRTNTGKFYNWATWNAGYHAAHHFGQSLHWTELPAYHATLASRIPQELQTKGWPAASPRRTHARA